MQNNGLTDTLITAYGSDGAPVRGVPVRLSRHAVVFETDRQSTQLQVSEVLSEVKIVVQNRPLYQGRAVITNILDIGGTLVCEASLSDGWQDLDFPDAGVEALRLRKDFDNFMRQWEQFYRIGPDFKIMVSDMQSFLCEMRLFMEQAELGIRSASATDAEEDGRNLALGMSALADPALDAMFDRFETVAAGIPEDLVSAHQNYVRRQLHPTLLASPFAFRVVRKPLGYAGDYEMVNMILREPLEGASLFGKVLNGWFIKQPPAEAHRNRVKYLTQALTEESLRAVRLQKPLRVFNIGCGPAREIQDYFAECAVADVAEFTLIDFNEETMQHAKSVLEASRKKHDRNSRMQFIKKSVVQLLKARSRDVENRSQQYDFVYCAGLYDYLPEPLCKQLLNMFYDMVAPGGRLLVTNVDPSNPIRRWLGYVLEWHLIYRDAKQMLHLKPDLADAQLTRTCSDITGVNIFLEIRKPE
jgi:extracellular factor (EF) 3-hydroxypalmitic acid methyl ester biosynthesis protein